MGKMKKIWIIPIVICGLFAGCGQPENPENITHVTVDSSGPMPIRSGEETEAVTMTEEKPETEEDSANRICVHICGAVQNPGVYYFEPDVPVRVVDVVEAAGGYSEEAAKDYLNLAATVKEGDKVVVPYLPEVTGDVFGENAAGGNSFENPGEHGGKVNLNTASAEELATLPGIGEGKAQLILKYRRENGPFSDVAQLMQVSGIGESTYEGLEDRITVE